jgi:serine/threonine-protein kinase
MRLRTPHVGKLLDVGNLDAAHGALPYLALEYLEGTDLGRLVEGRGPVPYRDAFSWCADACDAVGEAHSLGVIHRDLKPSNVFLATTDANPNPVIKVIDFGVAAGDPQAGADAKITAMGAVLGSPAYMAPEQMMATGDLDPRADVWSMGVLLYEILCGDTPFRGKDYLSLFANVMTKPPLPLRARIAAGAPPPEAEAVVLRCLRRPREERYETMEALASDLRAMLAS